MSSSGSSYSIPCHVTLVFQMQLLVIQFTIKMFHTGFCASCKITVHLAVILQNNKNAWWCIENKSGPTGKKNMTTETPGWSYRKWTQPFGLAKCVKPSNWCQNTSASKSMEITGKTSYTKPTWNILIVNCITNRCVWNTCVTWQGIDCRLPEDDMIVSKHVAVW